jgi:hypothetical protein
LVIVCFCIFAKSRQCTQAFSQRKRVEHAEPQCSSSKAHSTPSRIQRSLEHRIEMPNKDFLFDANGEMKAAILFLTTGLKSS